MLLDIVILPPAELREKIGRKIKKAAKGIKPVFVVDNKRLIPHLSLFHIRTPGSRMKKLELRIKKILKKYRPILVKSRTAALSGSGSGVIFIKTSSGRNLEQLRADVLKASSPLRTGMMPWMIGSRRPTRLEMLARKRYGTHLSFHPHITAAMLKDPREAPKIVGKLKKVNFKFLADTVAITEVNFWHQATRVIKKLKLKG